MTEYEVLDLISTMRSEAAFHVMNFAAAMFGYVAAAYFVGEKLSRHQTIAITFLFCLFVPGPLVAAYDTILSLSLLVDTYGGEFESVGNIARGIATVAPILVPSIIVCAWIVSVVFMYQVRKS